MDCSASYRQLVTGTAVSMVREETGPDPALIVRRGLRAHDVRAYARFHGLSLRAATEAVLAAAPPADR